MSKRSRKRKGAPTRRETLDAGDISDLYLLGHRHVPRHPLNKDGGPTLGDFVGRDNIYRRYAKSWDFANIYGMGDFVDVDPHADAIDVEFTVQPIQEPGPPPILLLDGPQEPGTEATE